MMLFKAAVWAVTWPLAVLPLKAALWLGAAGGGLVFRLWFSRRKFAVGNVEKAVAAGRLQLDVPAEEIARGSFRDFGMGVMEVIRIYHGRKDALMEKVEIVGAENYLRAKAKGRGVIWITGHCGNWEMMALALPIKLDVRFGVVARAQNNRFLHQLVEEMRSISGNEVIYKRGAVRGVLKLLRQKGDPGILIDQAVLVKEGELVDFLGRPAVTTKLPAIIARKTGAPVIASFVHRNDKGGHTITISPEIEPCDHPDPETAALLDMQKMTDLIEDYIREHPAQWLWGHRRWKRAPEVFPEGKNPRRLIP